MTIEQNEIYGLKGSQIEDLATRMGAIKSIAEGKAPNTNFTGATSLADGTAGLVPAPATTDVDKVLKGDGTWSTIPAGATVITDNEFNTLWENA